MVRANLPVAVFILFCVFNCIPAFADVTLNNGKIGVGTLSPAHPVDVVGEINSTSWMTAGCVNSNDPNDIMVAVGDWCVDKYEASVWSTPTGGTQRGISSADYPCQASGQDCATSGTKIYARSVANVYPSQYITWFQASIACANSGKHLLTNAEWQTAAAGTPSGTGASGVCVVSGPIALTDANSGCVSAFGAVDMTGNVGEYVQEWISGLSSSLDPVTNIFGFGGSGNLGDVSWNIAGPSWSGSGWVSGSPSALIRGGMTGNVPTLGIFAINANHYPTTALSGLGFRCGRRR